MKLLLRLAILIAVFSFNLKAQIAFQKTYGFTADQWGYAVKQCFDGGYISTGYIAQLSGQYNIYVLKTDAFGDTLWTKQYGGDNMVGFDVIQLADSSYLVSGYKNAIGYGILEKIDVNGNTIWTQVYTTAGTAWVQAVQQTYDNGFICGGGSLFKTSSAGTLLWSAPYISEQIMYVIQTTDSNYVAAEFYGGTSYLEKFDTAGALLWTKSFTGTIVNTSNNCLAQTNDSGFVFTARRTPGGALLMKTDSNGDTLWTKVFPTMLYPTSVVQTSDGGYALAGKSYTSQMMLLKTNSLGTMLWSNTFIAGTTGEAKSIRETADHGFILIGGTHFTSTNQNLVFLVKTDSV